MGLYSSFTTGFSFPNWVGRGINPLLLKAGGGGNWKNELISVETSEDDLAP